MWIAVACGGAIGALLRYFIVNLARSWLGAGFPYGVLAVNIIGALVIGYVVGLARQTGLEGTGQNTTIHSATFGGLDMRYGTPAYGFIVTGLLGGLTTFSAFSLDAYDLYNQGAKLLAGLYVLASPSLAIGAVIIGMRLARLG